MEGKCHPIFEKVAKIHSHAHVVAQVWNAWDIDADRRQESLNLMRKRGEELKETKVIRNDDIKDYFKLIDDLEHLNKEDGQLTTAMRERMEGVTAELAVNAILDCGCPEPTVRDVRDKMHEEYLKGGGYVHEDEELIKLDMINPGRTGMPRG